MIPNLLSKKGPLFKKKLYQTRPNLPKESELFPKIKQMLASQWVTNFGNFHNELEENLKKTLKVKHVLLCSNGTIGLFLLLKALGLKGRVITSPFTFPATIHAIYMAGIEPAFCDIDPDDYCISPESVEKCIDSKVSAILGVNVFGNILEVEALEKIGAKHRVPLLYDSAHAFFTFYKGKPVGGFGKAEMFSFHATKLFTTLEGGAITTNDEELFRKLKLLINFGIKDEEHIIDIGLNGKMSEINAIFGLLSLNKIEKVVKKLSFLFEIYRKKLQQIPGIKFQKIRKEHLMNNQYMPIEIIPEEFGLNRDQVHLALREDNVIARKYFFPLGNLYDCYKDMEFAKNSKLPNAEKVASRILCLPIYSSLEAGDIEKICFLVESIHNNRKEIQAKFSKPQIAEGKNVI